jgi:uncharacterized protein YkwD
MWLFLEGRRQLVLMALLAISVSLVLVAGILQATNLNVGSSGPYQPTTDVMQDFTDMTNRLRLSNGLLPLEPSPNLELSAKAKLASMANDGYWGHYGPGNESFSKYIWQYEPNATLAGENLARCFSGHKEAFDGLINSPTHYKVLTGDFSKVGVASRNQDGCESIVMHFSK